MSDGQLYPPTIVWHSLLYIYTEKLPPPLYPPPGSTPLDNASYYYYYYNNYYYLYLDLVDPGVLSIHKSNLIQFAKKKMLKTYQPNLFAIEIGTKIIFKPLTQIELNQFL